MSDQENKGLYAATLGFDTRFQMKSLVHLGRSRIDRVLSILPRKHDDKSARALEELRRFCRDVMGIKEFDTILVDLDAGYASSIAEIYLGLAGVKDIQHLYIDLSGGMRLLVLYTFMASQLYRRSTGVPVTYIVWREDLEGYAEMPGDIMDIPLYSREDPQALILEKLAEKPMTTSELARETGMPKSTIYKYLKEMTEQGLLERQEKGKYVFYIPSGKGRLAAGIILGKRPR